MVVDMSSPKKNMVVSSDGPPISSAVPPVSSAGPPLSSANVNRMDQEQQKITADQQKILAELQKISADHQKILANQQDMIEKLGHLNQQKIVVDQQTIVSNQQAMLEKLVQLQSRVDILSAGGDEDAPVKGVGHRGVQKRKREKPIDLKDNTDPTRDIIDKRVKGYRRLELDERPDKSDISFLKSWLLGKEPSIEKVDCGNGEHGESWFADLKMADRCLKDSHMDAALHLLRRRRHYLKDQFRQDAIVLNISFQDQFEHLHRVNRIRGKDSVIWDDTALQYMNGDPEQFLSPWYPNVKEIYFCLKLKKHWVVVQASLVKHIFVIYDSHISANSEEAMKKLIGPYCKYFPALLLQSGKFFKAKLPDVFKVCRCSAGEVPQLIRSVDSGMFAIKLVEHLMTGTDIMNITNEEMYLYRNVWCLDLFYQAIPSDI